MVQPSARPSFRGLVVELIGPYTLSAGETFAQGLMGRTPRVTRIGENTQGVFSDVLARRLPNGWTFGLPKKFVERRTELRSTGWAFLLISIFRYSLMRTWLPGNPAMEKAIQILGKH